MLFLLIPLDRHPPSSYLPDQRARGHIWGPAGYHRTPTILNKKKRHANTFATKKPRADACLKGMCHLCNVDQPHRPGVYPARRPSALAAALLKCPVKSFEKGVALAFSKILEAEFEIEVGQPQQGDFPHFFF